MNIIKEGGRSEVFMTSDLQLHFSHNNILKYCPDSRPFSSIEEMDEKIVENWNNKVTEHDFVYILGDISFGKPSYTCEILKRLNGKKYLIMGNHDGNKYLRERDFINQF